jgi:hypothetical protein
MLLGGVEAALTSFFLLGRDLEMSTGVDHRLAAISAD